MTLQVLVAAMNEDGRTLADKMNLRTDAIIINQCDHYDYQELSIFDRKIQFFSMAERGVGLSRNNALLRSTADIVLFSDEDIRYREDYESIILNAFEKNPDADGIAFNVNVDERRATYRNEDVHRIRWNNYGRYPTYALAVRREAVIRGGITFSLLFGGGAKYSNGEDSLFFHDCLKKGLHLYAVPDIIGEEVYRESTWFKGYNEKFFFDRGVLYPYLYGKMAGLMAFRFLFTKRKTLLTDLTWKQARKLMKQGIKEGRDIRGKAARQ